MRHWWIVACVVTACVHDSYHCEVDTDCNLGDGGRCEADHYCTHFDSSCMLTQRSYTEHSNALSGTCFVGETTLLNYCAPGQPPSKPTGCAAKVCTTLAACCTTGWSEACVLEAQQQCPEVQCETRIAIAASHGGVVEVSEARFVNGAWTATRHSDLGIAAAELAPAPGTVEPRLAGFANAGQVLILSSTGTQSVDLDGTREYHDLLSLDFDRDLRDTLLLDYQDADAKTQLEQVVKLGTGESRDIDTGVSNHMAWGAVADSTGFVDGYPDGAASNGNAYKVLINKESNQSKDRSLDTGIASSFDTNNTPNGGTASHTFSWIDVDGDGLLDLVGFGNTLNVHTGMFTDTPSVEIDCGVDTFADCFAGGGSAAVATATYNGTVIPASGTDPARILAAPFIYDGGNMNTPSMYAITINANLTFSYVTLSAASVTTCPTCAIEAVIVRDFDGDGRLDILAIDSMLDFYTALWRPDHSVKFTQSNPVPAAGTYGTVRTSVSGVPR